MLNRYAKSIIRSLEGILSSGSGASQIFDDFLDMTHTALEAVPTHLRSAIKNQTLAADTPEGEKLFARLRERYKSKIYWDHFANAFYTLLESTDGDSETIAWDDTIGQVYMEWGISNKHTGQFFTPFILAQMMASMMDIESEVYRRLEAAYRKSVYGIMHAQFSDDVRIHEFVRKMGETLITLCVEHFEPIKVNDCSCGSGVMFLAAAEKTPRWALNWGLVQFYGQDIDQTCVKMAQVNMMIYGLNGYSLKCVLALVPEELLTIPEPFQSAYTLARLPENKGHEIEVAAVEINKYRQGAML